MNMQNDPLVQVQVDESEDTEWNDILRQKGVIPERPPSPTAALEEALDEALKKQHDNRLEDKDLSDLEDLEDEEDEDFLNMYKQKRLKEIAKLQQKSRFGEVFEINKPEYHKEITLTSMGSAKEGNKSNYIDEGDERKEQEDASGVYVFVHLSLQSKLQSRILSNLFRILAPKYREIKFVEIACNRAIENYPESNCPTVLVYYKGEVVKSLVTLLELGGNDTKLDDFEQFMVRVGALNEKDNRLIINQDDEEAREARKLEFAGKGIRSGIKEKFNVGIGASEDEDDFFD